MAYLYYHSLLESCSFIDLILTLEAMKRSKMNLIMTKVKHRLSTCNLNSKTTPTKMFQKNANNNDSTNVENVKH